MSASTEIPVVSPRQPCPCGSGKRYKVCHGKRARDAERHYVARPFAGLPGECDWVAMREIVSAATAPLQLAGSYADRDVVVCTLLPGAAPAMVRQSGTILLALQTVASSGDPAADLGHALTAALGSEPGSTVTPGPRPGDARLHDLVDGDNPLDVTVHDGFDYWFDTESEPGPEGRSSLAEANSAVVPAARLTSVSGAYWCRLGDRDQVRWVLPYDEEPLLDGLARLHAAEADTLGEGTRLLGTFRTHGLLVPVWDLTDETTVQDVEEPARALADRLDAAMADSSPLGRDERRARAGLANRQVTIR